MQCFTKSVDDDNDDDGDEENKPLDELWVHVRHAECSLVAIGDPVNTGLERGDAAGSKSNNGKEASAMSEARRLLHLCGL